MKVVPRPDNWLSYKPRPDMKGKRLGVFAHCFTRDGEQGAIKEKYQRICDVAIEEKTCIVLSGSLSLVEPTHHLLYEEWADYDEFFEVQLARTYRHGFFRWLDPIKEGIVSPEFTEMFYSSGKHPVNIAYHAYTLVQSIHIAAGHEEEARQLFIQHIDDVGREKQNSVANIHQSLNNPQHFLLYEIWSDFSHLIENELRCDRRIELETRLNALKDEALPGPAKELFQIYYDPDKYVPPEELF